MNTERMTTLDLDAARLESDLGRTRSFRYSDAYSEFICGQWRSCMLWNKSGDVDDNFLKDFEHPARITAYGRAMSYLAELLEQTFRLEYLRFARLAKLTPGSVLIPHRDYLELRHELTRIHVPLATDSQCFSAEENVIYQMKLGEVWYIDAAKTHSAASLSRQERTHLILDFTEVDQLDAVLRRPLPRDPAIPEENRVPRRPLEPGEKEAFFGLARIIDAGNYKDVLGLLIKKYFTSNLDVSSIFDWLSQIAAGSGNPEVMAQVQWHQKHCLIQR